jgi:hypothetical protein
MSVNLLKDSLSTVEYLNEKYEFATLFNALTYANADLTLPSPYYVMFSTNVKGSPGLNDGIKATL